MSDAVTTSAKPNRNRLLLLIAVAIVIIGVLYGLWYFLVAAHYESTDDAYVAGNVVQITPQVSGTVVAIKADDTDMVKPGQELLDLDKADSQVALEQAEAQLAQTVREVRTLYANNGTLDADIAVREADMVKARAELDRAQSDIWSQPVQSQAKKCSISSRSSPTRKAPMRLRKRARRQRVNNWPRTRHSPKARASRTIQT